MAGWSPSDNNATHPSWVLGLSELGNIEAIVKIILYDNAFMWSPNTSLHMSTGVGDT